jgi:hypothetical protein
MVSSLERCSLFIIGTGRLKQLPISCTNRYPEDVLRHLNILSSTEEEGPCLHPFREIWLVHKYHEYLYIS